MSHTPTPWKPIAMGRRLRGGRGQAFDIAGNCGRSPENWEIVASAACEEDAARIVLAVNCHDDLLAACKAHDEWYELVKQNYPEMMRPYEQGRAAIAKATNPTTN